MNARLRRERQIAEVVVRQGFGFLVDVAGPQRGWPFERVAGRGSVSSPERLRLALEELGPTFVKLGQILSTRADLLPPDYRLELAKLQDAAQHLSPETVSELVSVELGDSLEGAFASFELEPVAAASIGQAHAALLNDGTAVVVKVRRPGAAETIEQDLEILRNCAVRASRRWDRADAYDFPGLVEEFVHTLRAELDYLREGHNAERFAASFAGDSDVQIPRVFWEYTTSRVITLERIEGMKITDLAALDEAGVDRRELALRATRVTAKTVFEDGFFHADPHPGNFFIDPHGRIGIIDFGMVGTLSDRMRDQLAAVAVAVVRRDPERLGDALIGLGSSTHPVDRARLRDDLAGLLDQLDGRGAGDVEVGSIVGEILDTMRRHQLRIPRDLALLLKAFVMDEGLATQLDPDFRLAEALEPYVYRHLLSRLSLSSLATRLKRFGIDAEELALDLPSQIHRALGVLGTGGFDLHLRADELQPIADRAESLVNRIAMSVLAAAAIDGFAELAAANRARIPTTRTLKVWLMLGSVLGLIASVVRRRSTPSAVLRALGRMP
jgi:ubiquinone biosynthesis protein